MRGQRKEMDDGWESKGMAVVLVYQFYIMKYRIFQGPFHPVCDGSIVHTKLVCGLRIFVITLFL